MTDFPLPSNVKEVLSRMPVADQGEKCGCIFLVVVFVCYNSAVYAEIIVCRDRDMEDIYIS